MTRSEQELCAPASRHHRLHEALIHRAGIPLVVLLIFFCFLAVACQVRMGYQPNIDVLETSLRVGESRPADVLLALGQPFGKGKTMLPISPRPRTMWSYYYAEGDLDGARGVYLFVYFDQGRYDGYMWFSSLPKLSPRPSSPEVTREGAQVAKGKEVIQNGSALSLEYALSDAQGSLIESNSGEDPFRYTHGQGQIIPGLEKVLEGMQVGEHKTFQLKAEDAYGSINPSAFHEVPREKIHPEILKVGAGLLARTAQGQIYRVRVHEIRERTVVLDFNHPLAGKTLTFKVKILAIQPVKNKNRLYRSP